MQSLTCISCPIGCSLEISGLAENLSVIGNQCPRGLNYALEEIRAPKRLVTATVPVKTNNNNSIVRRVPVKTAVPCLREKIPELLKDIYKIKVTLPVKAGDIVITDWNGEGIDVVVTRSINNQ